MFYRHCGCIAICHVATQHCSGCWRSAVAAGTAPVCSCAASTRLLKLRMVYNRCAQPLNKLQCTQALCLCCASINWQECMCCMRKRCSAAAAAEDSPELHALQLSRVVPEPIIEEGPEHCQLGEGAILPEIWHFVVPERVCRILVAHKLGHTNNGIRRRGNCAQQAAEGAFVKLMPTCQQSTTAVGTYSDQTLPRLQ